jgi:cytochrome c oxidase subunit 3
VIERNAVDPVAAASGTRPPNVDPPNVDHPNVDHPNVDPAAAQRVGREPPSPLAVGVAVWLASEAMFFGGLFAAWFVLKAHNEPRWPPGGEQLDVARTFVFTLVLIASSFTIHHAVRLAESGRRRAAAQWLVVTIALGTTFVLGQVWEYATLPFEFDRDSYTSIYYLLTGFHGAHVIGGLVLMGLVAWVVFSAGTRAPLGSSFRATSYYWHFVDVVWVVLFAIVYVIS